MKLENSYRKKAKSLKEIEKFEGIRSIGYRSPSNIALVKYWGKRDVQLPQNPSLSFSLASSYTKTLLQYSFDTSRKFSVGLIFENKANWAFEKRILTYLEQIVEFIPFIRSLAFKIESKNSFPHSAGIASSASAMSALALCLVTIEHDLFGTLNEEKAFLEKASFLSRLGSGSAARSVYGNYSVWGESQYVSGSSDEIAVPFDKHIHSEFLVLGDAILITNSESKKVSSSMGHNLMNDHPYAVARYQQADENLKKLINALETGDEQLFVDVVENEALSLHALMMSSSIGYSLLNQNTWEIINKIRKFREENNTFAAFTLDAGPNVHLIYKLKDRNKIVELIEEEILEHCENRKWIDDKMGHGPDKIL